jgi:hypothetical protein
MQNTTRFLHVAGLIAWILFTAAPAKAGERASDAEVESLKQFIAREVNTLNTKNESVKEKVSRLNDVNDAVNKVVEAVRQDDTKSIENAMRVAVLYQQAITATEGAAKLLGEQVQRTGNVFKAVEKKEGDGTIPKGTLSVDDKLALDRARKTLGVANEATPRAAESSQIVKKTLGESGVVLLDGSGVDGRPAGLVLMAGYLPEGTISGGSVNGFVIIVNNDTEADHEAYLDIIVKGEGNASPDHQKVAVSAGGTSKADFTINISPNGKLTYAPYLDPATEKKVKPR